MEDSPTSNIFAPSASLNYDGKHRSAGAQERAQIYLSLAQQEALGRLATEFKCSKSALIRHAIDGFLNAEAKRSAEASRARASKRKKAAALAIAMWANREDMSDVAAYLRESRLGRHFNHVD